MRDLKTVTNTAKNQLAKLVEIDKNKTAPRCRNCVYYQPTFKYRKCLFTKCPYGKSSKCIFRERPLNIQIPKKQKPGATGG